MKKHTDECDYIEVTCSKPVFLNLIFYLSTKNKHPTDASPNLQPAKAYGGQFCKDSFTMVKVHPQIKVVNNKHN